MPNKKPTSRNTRIKDLEVYLIHFHRGKDYTKKRNARKLKAYCEWLGKSPSELLEEYHKAKISNDLDAWQREQVNRVLGFYKSLTESVSSFTKKKFSLNYCRTLPLDALSFYRQNCRQLTEVTEEFAPVQLPTNEFRFTQDDLRKMFYFGDVEEKALVSLAVSYAQSSKDFLDVECEQLRNTISEAKDKGLQFAMWLSTRSKTSIQIHSFLTPEAIESVDAYLQLLAKKHNGLPKFIWCNSHSDKHITNEGLNKKLKRLVEKANIKTYNKQVKFHCIRKFTFSRLRRIDSDIAKIIVGKKASSSDMTYEEVTERCGKVFQLAYKDICLNGDASGKVKQKQAEQIKQLQQALIKQQQDIQSQKTIIETLTDKVSNQDATLTKIERIVMYSLEQHRFITKQAELECLKEITETNKPLKDIIKKYAITETDPFFSFFPQIIKTEANNKVLVRQ